MILGTMKMNIRETLIDINLKSAFIEHDAKSGMLVSIRSKYSYFSFHSLLTYHFIVESVSNLEFVISSISSEQAR